VTARLRSDLQVSALQRACASSGLFFSVLRKGHEEGGIILIKWVEGRRACLFTERSLKEGRRWVELLPPGDEADARDRIASETSFDPDLWVVEVEGAFAHAQTLLSPVA
jgi:hypothetical protein